MESASEIKEALVELNDMLHCNFHRISKFLTKQLKPAGACTLKPFTAVLLPYRNKLECLSLQSSYILAATRLGAIKVDSYNGHHYGRLLPCPRNIKLRYKLPTLTNTQAYYLTETITAVKTFIVQVKLMVAQM